MVEDHLNVPPFKSRFTDEDKEEKKDVVQKQNLFMQLLGGKNQPKKESQAQKKDNLHREGIKLREIHQTVKMNETSKIA